jgi:hypothetical protein
LRDACDRIACGMVPYHAPTIVNGCRQISLLAPFQLLLNSSSR